MPPPPATKPARMSPVPPGVVWWPPCTSFGLPTAAKHHGGAMVAGRWWGGCRCHFCVRATPKSAKVGPLGWGGSMFKAAGGKNPTHGVF